MKFNTTDREDIEEMKRVLTDHIESGDTIEIKKTHPKRSLGQNSYLHVILQIFALEYGETLAHVKQEIFKKIVNKATFVNEDGLKSTSNLSTAELTKCIETFRNWSSKELNIYLPSANEKDALDQAQEYIKRNSSYEY